MYRFVVLALVAHSQVSYGLALPVDDVTKDNELVFAFMIHRHGDRTPASEGNTAFSNNPVALKKASLPYGYGQLTNIGKQRAYDMGLSIRERYGELLSPKFNRSEVFTRSTDSTRAKMTVLSAMAAVFPAVDPRWSQDVNWEPVPYTLVPTKYDFIQAMANCPEFIKKMGATFLENPVSMEPFKGILKELSTLLGYSEPIFETLPVMTYAVNDLFDSQVSLGVPLTPELEALRPQVAEVAGLALRAIYGNKDYFALQAGPLLQEFLDYSAKVIAGIHTQKLRIYSAHDMNVYALEAALQLIPDQGVPKYASFLSLELRRNLVSGEYNVLPVYLPSPGTNPKYLEVDGCDSVLCSYKQFSSIISPYALDVDAWRTKCGWTNDFVVDDSYIV